jgi:chemotaxis protein methyltransferase CheR
MDTQQNIIKFAWDTSFIYAKTVIDIIREPVLILDAHFSVLDASEPFYHMFKTRAQDTQGKSIYELGSGQWNIPGLRKLLEDVLPMHTFFKGFEVNADFPLIGKKIMILNARQIYTNTHSYVTMPIIILVIEDITKLVVVAERVSKALHKHIGL